MTSWKNTLLEVGHLVENRFDKLRYGLKQRLQYDKRVQVIPYLSYGNEDCLLVKGRVLESRVNVDEQDEESLWRNLANAYQRFESDEVPNLQLELQLAGHAVSTQTDEEGYFRVKMPPAHELDRQVLWHEAQISVPPQAALKDTEDLNSMSVTGQVLVPPEGCDLGIISDIDDTILVTHATSLLTMARLTFLHSAASRLPFAGVSAFYQALIQGPKNAQGQTLQRPIFYVSSSPWNLYDFLIDFMELNHIPVGPLMLRDFGLKADLLGASGHHGHKFKRIQEVMDTYPDLAFILIGDSGQHDPEIYADIVAERPQQVKAIYIRDVSGGQQRDQEVQHLATATSKHHIDMLLVADTLAAAQHAAEQGYISAEALQSIQIAVENDKAPADPVEEAVRREDD